MERTKVKVSCDGFMAKGRGRVLGIGDEDGNTSADGQAPCKSSGRARNHGGGHPEVTSGELPWDACHKDTNESRMNSPARQAPRMIAVRRGNEFLEKIVDLQMEEIKKPFLAATVHRKIFSLHFAGRKFAYKALDLMWGCVRLCGGGDVDGLTRALTRNGAQRRYLERKS